MKTAIHHMVVLLCLRIGAKVVSPDRNAFNWLDRFLFNEYKKVIAEWPLFQKKFVLIRIFFSPCNATF